MGKCLRSRLLGSLGLALGTVIVVPAVAATIPYPDPGTPNPASYSFMANGGDITGYYLGQIAAYDETLGLLANGVKVASGLFQNHSTPFGRSYDFGAFAAGTVLTFFIDVQSTDATFYSNKAMNPDGVQHIYSDAYTGYNSGGIIVPIGTYVGFEDLSPDYLLYPNQEYKVDYDYNDEQFSFTNTTMSVIPLPASAPLFGAAILAFGAVGYAAKRKRAAEV